MFFRALCPLTDCVWKFIPDKSTGLPVIQFQALAAAMVTAALPACPVAAGVCLFVRCCNK